MAITYTNDNATISTTEYSIPGDAAFGAGTVQTTQGVFQFLIDFGAMAAGDQFRVRLYEKTVSTGTQRLVEEWILTNIQSKPMLVTPSVVLGGGWDVTVLKLAGTDRSIPWSIRKLA